MLTGPVPQLIELRKLAVGGADFIGEIPLNSLSRLQAESLSGSDDARVAVKLELDQGDRRRPCIVGDVSASITVECQRCLQPMELELQAAMQLVFVWTETEFQSIEEGWEPIVAGEERVDLYELIEEELLLQLPYSNRHDEGVCNMAEHQQELVEEPEQTAEESESPFDVLKQLKLNN